jgi:hypothetical protein
VEEEVWKLAYERLLPLYGQRQEGKPLYEPVLSTSAAAMSKGA